MMTDVKRTTPSLAAFVALVLAAALAAPGLAAVCAPAPGGDACPLMQAGICEEAVAPASQHDHSLARDVPECCTEAGAPVPVPEAATVSPAPSAVLLPTVIGQAIEPIAVPAREDRAAHLPRSSPTPLYTLHATFLI